MIWAYVGFDFTVSKSVLDSWFLYAYTSFFYEDETFLAVESGNVEFTNKINGLYLYLANYLTLSGDGTLTGELAFSHMSTCNAIKSNYLSIFLQIITKTQVY